jgi:hypothetical protein
MSVEAGENSNAATGLRAAVSNQNRSSISKQYSVSNQDFQDILSEATADNDDTFPILQSSEFPRSESVEQQEPILGTTDTPGSAMEAAKYSSIEIGALGLKTAADTSGVGSLSWSIPDSSSIVGEQRSGNLALTPNKDERPRAMFTVDGSSSSQNTFVFAAIAAVMEQAPWANLGNNTGPETRSNGRFSSVVLDNSNQDNRGAQAVALGSQTGRVGEVIVSKDHAPELNSETDVEAFSLILQPRYNLPESTTSSENFTPAATESLAVSQQPETSPLDAKTSNRPVLHLGLDLPSNTDSTASHASSGRNIAQALTRQATNELGPQSPISTDYGADESGGRNVVQSIVTAARDGDSRRNDGSVEGASQTERSLFSGDPSDPSPSQTNTATIASGPQSALSSGYALGRESGIDVPLHTEPQISVVSDLRPGGRSRNISSASSPYRSVSKDTADEDSGGPQSNNSPPNERRSATLSTGPLTSDATEESEAAPAEKTSGLVPDSSQQSPSAAGSPDAPTKGDAPSKASAVSESLISSSPSSQQQHENSISQSGGSQPLFASAVNGTVASAGLTKSSSEPQSSSRSQPIDLTESGKLNSQGVGPVKEISIRIEASSGEIVHLKVVDQVSQVQIGVRSSNASLATNLRQDLSSLTAALDRLGWKSEPTSGSTSVGMVTTADAGSEGSDQSDSSHSQTAADWWNNPEQNRRSPSELWEEALDR